MKPLNPYGTDAEGVDLSFAGEVITDEEVAFDFALGNLNISGRKLEKVSDFDPEATTIVENPSYGKRASHTSIWTNGISVARISNSFSKVDKLQQNEQITLLLGPTPNKELANQTNTSHNAASTLNTSTQNHKTVDTLKSSDKKIHYISKYFKNKTWKEDNDESIAALNNTYSNDDKRETNTDDIVAIYNKKPKSIVNSPPGGKMEKNVPVELNLKSSALLNDENQENITILESKAKIEISHQKKHGVLRLQDSDSLSEKDNDDCIFVKEPLNSDNRRGEWFEELEKDTAVKDTKVIYNTQAISSMGRKEPIEEMDKCGSVKSQNSNGTRENTILNNSRLTNSPATREAFKPVLQNKYDNIAQSSSVINKQNLSLYANDAELEKTRKRNPFAKVFNPSPPTKKQDTINELDESHR